MPTQKENILIWKDTVKQCEKGSYKSCPKSISIAYDSLILTPFPRYDNMAVKVIDNDTLSCCGELIREGSNVMALNMAAPGIPGGGVRIGCYAQEENCFRRSNYFQSIDASLYPISETGCIYTPIVTVIKDKDYNLLDKPFSVSMLACAALRYPSLTITGQYTNISDRKLMKHKIEQIFQVGYQMKHDTLVLSAFGCGAFRNNPNEVAEIFNEVLATYNNCFKYVLFAIISQYDANYNVFNKIIKQTKV